jgi:hypothetical protein
MLYSFSLVETVNTKNTMLTYITSFATEIEASKYADSLIYGGVIQEQEGRYHVWQCNWCTGRNRRCSLLVTRNKKPVNLLTYGKPTLARHQSGSGSTFSGRVPRLMGDHLADR